MDVTITIRVSEPKVELFTDVPIHDLKLVTLLLDALLHTSAKIARNHNCADPLCEVQSFSQKVVYVITNGLEKELPYAKRKKERGNRGEDGWGNTIFGADPTQGRTPPSQPENY